MFERWLEKHVLSRKKSRFAVVTDGPWDMGRFLIQQCKVCVNVSHSWEISHFYFFISPSHFVLSHLHFLVQYCIFLGNLSSIQHFLSSPQSFLYTVLPLQFSIFHLYGTSSLAVNLIFSLKENEGDFYKIWISPLQTRMSSTLANLSIIFCRYRRFRTHPGRWLGSTFARFLPTSTEPDW